MPKKFALIFFLACIQKLFAQDLVIANVNIIPLNGRDTLLKNQTVFIKQGRIEKIVPFRQRHMAGKAQKLVDGTGKYLLPGLADMHVHFPDVRLMSNEAFFNLNLAAGVTVLRSMRGHPSHPALRDSIRRGLVVAPDLYISTALPSDSAVTAAQLKQFVTGAKKEKWDFVKYLSGLSPALFDSAAGYCRQNKIMLAGHVFNNELESALKNNQASVEHYQAILKAYRADSADFGQVIKQLRDKRIFVCPTLSFYYIWGMQIPSAGLLTRNGMERIGPAVKNKWEQDFSDYLKSFTGREKDFQAIQVKTKRNLSDFSRILKKLHDDGALLLLSPDESAYNVPGFALLEEMRLYRRAGISNYHILKIATRNAAAFFGAEKEWGSVETGKQANLLLLDENPLDDIDNVKTVNGTILHGKFYKPADLLKS